MNITAVSTALQQQSVTDHGDDTAPEKHAQPQPFAPHQQPATSSSSDSCSESDEDVPDDHAYDSSDGAVGTAQSAANGSLWQPDTAQADLFGKLDQVLAAQGAGSRHSAMQLLQGSGAVPNPAASVTGMRPASCTGPSQPAANTNPVIIRRRLPPTGAH